MYGSIACNGLHETINVRMPELPSCVISACVPWEPLKGTVCARGVRAPAPNDFELFVQAENECG